MAITNLVDAVVHLLFLRDLWINSYSSGFRDSLTGIIATLAIKVYCKRWWDPKAFIPSIHSYAGTSLR